jgi:Right handed beta helix region
MKRFAFHAVALLALAACDRSTQPAAPADRPALSTMASVACPASPTFTVSDEASLRAALAAASPGAVIAIRGMVGIAADVFVETPNVTITCAAAGAGLFALSPSIDALIIVDVGGSGAAIDGLVLDASAVSVNGVGAIFAGDFFGPGLPVPNVRFTHNTVTCSPGGCTLLAGTSGAVISNNTFTSAGSFTGVHVQLGLEDLDSVRIEGNTVVATAPSTDFRFGGIRLIGARHAVLRDNIVTGPWANSLSLATLSTSLITQNQLKGAAVYGIGLTRNPRLTTFVLSSTFSSNVVTGAASGGIFARKACGNVFVGNNLQGNTSNIGLIFPDTSGANTVVGNPAVIVDNGAYDCNGDGVNDPNIITGAGAVMHGVNLGQVVSDAVVSSNRLQ